MVLHRGKLAFDGRVNDATDFYVNSVLVKDLRPILARLTFA